VNGAGKSSVLGAAIRAARGEYYNADEAARLLTEAHPHLTQADANAKAWTLGRDGLERAIAERGSFAFETTLGGRTIVRLLEQALDAGLRVEMRYVGLDSPERHIARVQLRVAAGGHDIPSDKIRERFETSRANLVRLVPRLTRLEVFDNSREASPDAGKRPEPVPLLTVEQGRVMYMASRDELPTWAQPIAAAAMASHLASTAPRRKK
jgi:predicted ABC-type ATPase